MPLVDHVSRTGSCCGQASNRLRSTAQGVMFGIVRIGLGGWVLLLPIVQKAGFSTLAIVLAGMLFVSGAIGILFAPRTRGRDLQETGDEEVRARPAQRDLQTA